MATALFETKMDRWFKSMDVTGDGFVDKQDFDMLIEGILQATNAEKADEFRASTNSFWQTIVQMDSDNDARINSAEFAAGTHKFIREEGRFDELIRPMAELWFMAYDADGDGGVRFDEYKKAIGDFRQPDAAVEEGFAKLDGNGDGVITKEEWIEIVRDYCLNDDPDAAGNWMFGPPA